jgi:hypothetical protein
MYYNKKIKKKVFQIRECLELNKKSFTNNINNMLEETYEKSP